MRTVAEYTLCRLVEIDNHTLRIDKDPGFDKIPRTDGKEVPKDPLRELLFELCCAVESYIKTRYEVDATSEALAHCVENAEVHGNKYDPGKHTYIHHSSYKRWKRTRHYD